MGNKTNGDVIEVKNQGIVKAKNIAKEIFHHTTKYILEKSSRLARDVFYHGPGSW